MKATTVIALSLFLSVFVEGTTEYVFGTFVDKFPAIAKYRWMIMYLALVIGVAAALTYRIDIVSIVANVDASLFGEIVSGIAIGRGSNYLHQLVSKFLPAGNSQAPVL